MTESNLHGKQKGVSIDYETGNVFYWTRVTPEEMKKYREDKTLKWEKC